jgi:4-amino-4-deoxy-L-arabinose transferase
VSKSETIKLMKKLTPMDLQRRYAILLLLFFLGAYILPLGACDLLVPDETRDAEIPREMIAGGDWATPHLDGLRYFERPPLGYWINAGALLLLGQNNFALRFPSTMAVALTAVIICYLVKAAAIENAGDKRFTSLLAALIFLSCFGVAAGGNIAEHDSLFAFFLTVSLAVFYLGSESIPGSRHEKGYLLISGLACGLAFLTKGVLALVLYGLVLGSYLLWQRRYRDLFRMSWLPLLIAALTVLPWSLRVYSQAPDFWHYCVWNEPIRRFLADDAQHKASLWYFFIVVPGIFLPWTFAAPAAAAGGARQLEDPGPHGRLVRLSICWLALPFLFFSISGGKSLTLILPCFPPFAILMATGLSKAFNNGSCKVFDWGVIATGLLFGLILLVLMVVQLFNVKGLPVYSHPWKVTMVINGLVAMVLFCYWTLRSHSDRNKVLLLGFSPLLLLLLVHFTIPGEIIAQNAPGRLLEKYRGRIMPDTLIISGEEAVGAACWYLKRSDVYVLEPSAELTYDLQNPDAVGRLLNTEGAKHLIEQNRANTLLIGRAKKIDDFRKSLPRPVFEDETGPGGFVLLWY